RPRGTAPPPPRDRRARRGGRWWSVRSWLLLGRCGVLVPRLARRSGTATVVSSHGIRDERPRHDVRGVRTELVRPAADGPAAPVLLTLVPGAGLSPPAGSGTAERGRASVLGRPGIRGDTGGGDRPGRRRGARGRLPARGRGAGGAVPHRRPAGGRQPRPAGVADGPPRPRTSSHAVDRGRGAGGAAEAPRGERVELLSRTSLAGRRAGEHATAAGPGRPGRLA